MLKKSASGVLASLLGTVNRETRVSRGVADLPGQGASWRAGVGRVRSRAFLSILRGVLPLSLTSGPLNFHRATIVYSQTPSLGVRADICPAVSVQYFRTSERRRFSCG